MRAIMRLEISGLAKSLQTAHLWRISWGKSFLQTWTKKVEWNKLPKGAFGATGRDLCSTLHPTYATSH